MPLPLDIYVHILLQLPASRSTDSSIHTLINCSQTSNHLREAAVFGEIWAPHYNARYIHAIPRNERTRRESFIHDWYRLYAERRRLDQRCLDLLDEIVTERPGRYDKIKALCEDLSLDIWDALEIELLPVTPPIFRPKQPDDSAADMKAAPHPMTRRFWARAVLGALARRSALRAWGSLSLLASSAELTFEEAISAYSGFFGRSPLEVPSALDSLANECREYLKSKGHSLDVPESPDYNLPNICESICEFMRKQGFGGAEPANFHDFMNNFPHCFLSTHKHTLPLSLVFIFVAVARRLGIAASPTDFPARVLAHVASPRPDVPDFLVDVFGSSVNPIISRHAEEVLRLLRRAGASIENAELYTSPCPAARVLLRAAHNILNSSRAETEADGHTAIYAALCVHVLLTSDSARLSHIISVVALPPLECSVVLRDTLAPLLQPRCRESLEELCTAVMKNEESSAVERKTRSPPTPLQVKYHVGMFFQHARYEYIGCIIGWDITKAICQGSEDWIAQMGVNDLSRGRYQPFYPAISELGPQRYVAQENIKPIVATEEIVREFFMKAPDFAMFFEAAELDESGCCKMIMSPDLRATYPDDDEALKSA